MPGKDGIPNLDVYAAVNKRYPYSRNKLRVNIKYLPRTIFCGFFFGVLVANFHADKTRKLADFINQNFWSAPIFVPLYLEVAPRDKAILREELKRQLEETVYAPNRKCLMILAEEDEYEYDEDEVPPTQWFYKFLFWSERKIAYKMYQIKYQKALEEKKNQIENLVSEFLNNNNNNNNNNNANNNQMIIDNLDNSNKD